MAPVRPAQRLLGRGLDARVDGEHDGVAGLRHARERQDGVLPARVVLRAGERVVHGGLDARGAVLRGVVAHRVRGDVAVGVGAHVRAVVLLHGLGERHPVGGDDGPALDVAGLHDGVVVGGHLLVVAGADDLDVGEVADQDGEQPGEQELLAGEALGERHAAQHAGFGRVEQAAPHARGRTGVAARHGAGRRAAGATRRRPRAPRKVRPPPRPDAGDGAARPGRVGQCPRPRPVSRPVAASSPRA